MKLNVISLRPLWYTLSAIMILGSLILLGTWGLKQGIEFTGGSLLVVQFTNRPSPTEVSQTIQQKDQDNLGQFVAQPIGDRDMQFRLRNLSEKEHENLTTILAEAYPGTTEQRFDAIGPVLGEELRNKSVQGLIVVLLAIMAYVAYVFRKVSAPVQSWKYGLITLIAAFHDVIVPVGVFCILGRFFGTEIGTPFIAAILTVMGYSVTDTIVVLDRVRENLPKMSTSFKEVVAASLRQTYLRSFNTSVTTLLTLFAIFFFGGKSLHDFTLTLIIGILVGTYSSIFIASPLLVTWNEWSQRRAVKK
ncbi:protein translocase subunit SecF [Patescibacteria group bacterium]|nr:protein translocase subunit SecF [Patescibacteria group bacterium]